MRRLVPIGFLFFLILTALSFTACVSDQQKLIDNSNQTRTDAQVNATSLYPLPINKNFPLRQALRDFTIRQDLINHPWYIYILSDYGTAIGYYVAKTVPINACDFLSQADSEHASLDGIFYGGNGASGACDAWFFFDYGSSALIQIRGVKYFSSDYQLLLHVDPIVVDTTTQTP